jgi:alanyl-tRNA synthetase
MTFMAIILYSYYDDLTQQEIADHLAAQNEKIKSMQSSVIMGVANLIESRDSNTGTHVKNTSDIERIAILKVESKGSNLYRIEAVTGSRIESSISDAVSNYVEEITKQLGKAKEILEDAKKLDKELRFDIILDQVPLNSYNAIIYNRNQLEYIQGEVRKLDKEFNNIKMNNIVNDLSFFLNKKEDINDVSVILSCTDGLDVPSLKTISDNLVNQLGNSFVLLANVDGDNVNFVCRSSCSLNAGLIVKSASQRSLGNGGGSPTFAQGGGKTIEFIDEIFASIREDISNLE